VGGAQPGCLFGIYSDSLLVIRDASLFTFYESILSTVLTLALGLPAAFLFARYNFIGKRFLRTLTAIPFMLPTVVVAAGFTALLGPRGWMNLALMHLFGLATAPIVLPEHWQPSFWRTFFIIQPSSSALLVMPSRISTRAWNRPPAH